MSTASTNKRAKTGDGEATGNHGDGEALRPKVVYLVRWELNIVIEEFSDDAFDDCYGDEYQDAMDMYKEQEQDVSETSDVAYETIQKATAAAKKKFETLRNQYLGDVKYVDEDGDGDDEDEEEDDDEDDRNIIFVSRDENGGKSWSWEECKFHDDGGNCLSCTGSVEITTLRVIECDGKIFKECSLEVK